HQLVIGDASMIGTAIANRESRVEQDVTAAKAFARNPLLPDTQSEIALPMRTREKVLGALTVQSAKLGAFPADTVTVLQSMADQLGVAIENASLFDRVQATLAETDRLYQASRRVNEAGDEQAVYRALVEYAKESGLVDACQIITVDPRATDFFISPAMWSREPIPYDVADRFPRDRFQFGNRLASKEIIIISDVMTDPQLDRLTRFLFSRNHIQSAAMIPIHAEDEWLGTLALHAATLNAFAEADLQSFITLADQTAVILANLQLLRQTESLYRIGRELSQSLTRDDALKIAVSEVAEYTGAVQCRFVLYDERRQAGLIQAESTPTPLASALRLPMRGDTIYELIKANYRPVLLEDNNQTADDTKDRYLRPFAARASLIIPASSQQDLIGFMALDSKRGIRKFKQTNIVFARTVVEQLTTQIENLKLLDEALDRAQELITLNQIHSRIATVLDMNELARSIYGHVGQLLDNTVFLLATYDEDTRRYEPILSIDRGQELAESPRLLQEPDPLFQFLHSSKAMTAESILLTRPSIDGPAPVSGIWVPLQQEGQPSGLISVQSYDANAYSENDAQLLRSIGTQTSLAIANAQLFEHIQASNEELRQLDLLKTQFLANMSHELRTPLNSIIGFSRVILKGIDGPITTEQQEDLTLIFNNGHHLLSLINEILDMAKIEAGKMALAFEQVKLETVARAAFSTIRSLVNPEKVDLVYDVPPDLPEIEADPVRLRQILVNLLSNAAKYTRQGQIRISARHETGDDKLLVLVEDTGIGIAEADFSRLFTAFEQVDNSTTRQVGGTGLGLPITRWLVESHQGEIWLESVVGEGTAFYVSLPLVRQAYAPPVASLTEAPTESFSRQGD
ncbi:MAG: GAF domain-containing protein, partial [Anaerolineae bacterium]